MRRGLYFLAGTAAGAYAASKARRAAEALTVDGVHDRLTGWFAGARVLSTEAKAAAAEKEAELLDRLAETPPRRLQLAPASPDGNTQSMPQIDSAERGDD